MSTDAGRDGAIRSTLVNDELARLLDTAVASLTPRRRTFTEPEALTAVWQVGYEVSPQIDPRFVLAREADGKHPRHWRLNTHILANDRLIDALVSNTWDGRDLDHMLEQLSTTDQVHYVFCPVDSRLLSKRDGTLDLADREHEMPLPAEVAAALAELGPVLLERWQATGAQPQTVRGITELLGTLGWPDAAARESWLLVRSWLRQWSAVARVGQDYWLPTDQLLQPPARTRLQVVAVRPPRVDPEPLSDHALSASAGRHESSGSAGKETRPVLPEQDQPSSSRWTLPLRTLHLLEGFVTVPASARSAYPSRGVGENDQSVVRGLWFETGEHLWLWLDRTQDRLYGTDLADKLAWCDAGDVLQIEWTQDRVVLRITGHDDEVQREETRLTDLHALGELRGGLGESYRVSLQRILAEHPDGLTFAALTQALNDRQQHVVHRGTVRTVLVAGGFMLRDGRWLRAPDDATGARTLRAALVERLVPPAHHESSDKGTVVSASLGARVKAIHGRLAELGDMLHIE